MEGHERRRRGMAPVCLSAGFDHPALPDGRVAGPSTNGPDVVLAEPNALVERGTRAPAARL